MHWTQHYTQGEIVRHEDVPVDIIKAFQLLSVHEPLFQEYLAFKPTKLTLFKHTFFRMFNATKPDRLQAIANELLGWLQPEFGLISQIKTLTELAKQPEPYIEHYLQGNMVRHEHIPEEVINALQAISFSEPYFREFIHYEKVNVRDFRERLDWINVGRCKVDLRNHLHTVLSWLIPETDLIQKLKLADYLTKKTSGEMKDDAIKDAKYAILKIRLLIDYPSTVPTL